MSGPEILAPSVVGGPREAYYVMRTLRMLEALAFRPRSCSELAAALEVHPRTIRRMLRQLIAEDWAVYDDATRRYSLNAHLPSAGFQAARCSALTERALPVLETLAQTLGMTARLFVPSYREVVSIASAAPDRPAQVCLGDPQPHHCSAPGRTLLAFRERWRNSALERSITPCTCRTVTDPSRLRAVLEDVRRRGCAFEAGEVHDGESSVAAPVWCDGEAVAALGVTTTDCDDRFDVIADDVVQAAARIGAPPSAVPISV